MRHPSKIRPPWLLLLSAISIGGVGCGSLLPGSGDNDAVGAKPPSDEPLVELSSAQFASAGISTARVEHRQASASLRLPGTLSVDPHRSWKVTPTVDGILDDVGAVAHDQVTKGQMLARLRSNALGEAQLAWLEARASLRMATADLERNKLLKKDGIVSEGQWLRVENEHQRALATLALAERRLTLAGMSAQRIEALEASDGRLGDMTLTSPASGVVLSSSVSRGQALSGGEVAFEIADISELWVTVHVPVAGLKEILPGAVATVYVTGGERSGWPGVVGSVGSVVNTADQTVEARVVADNAGGFLRPGMYAEVEVAGAPKDALMVPSGATFAVGNQGYIFEKVGETQFRPIAVTAGTPLGDWTPVGGQGVEPGIEVVVGGLAELKSHWLYEGGE